MVLSSPIIWTRWARDITDLSKLMVPCQQCHVRVSLLYITYMPRFVCRCVRNMELYSNTYTPYHCRSGMQTLRAGLGICSCIQQLRSHLPFGWYCTAVSCWLLIHDDDPDILPSHLNLTHMYTSFCSFKAAKIIYKGVFAVSVLNVVLIIIMELTNTLKLGARIFA